MRRRVVAWAAAMLATIVGTGGAQMSATAGRIVVQVDRPGAVISPTLYGLMTEEINHAYDGGLYAELVRNRTFMDDPKELWYWSVVQGLGATGVIAIDTVKPVNATALRRSLRLDITRVAAGQRVGVANSGYWGIPVRPASAYRASFYARASAGYKGPLTVDIESEDGTTVFASAVLPSVGVEWKKYEVTLKTKAVAASATNRLVIAGAAPGSIWLSLVSLFPPTYHDRVNGSRVDLMEQLAALRPGFLRFPGGNYLEGDSVATRFEWKTTVGPLEKRPGHQGPWKYRSSDGLGLLEFLEWCEDLGMEPVLAVFDGYALSGDQAMPGLALVPYVQEALDEIEYATGEVHTTWGARRAADGHPAPFHVRYVEIGNEEDDERYEARFAQFHDAIKAKYPALRLIATTRVVSRAPDLIDEHYYKSPGDMVGLVHHYDGHARTGPKIFVGEWATVEGSPTPTLQAALADAAWLTGLERNADLVIMASYAPLFVNVNPGAAQWRTNLIGYDALTSFGSPSYYAQRMFATHRGDRVLPVSFGDGASSVFATASVDTASGQVILKVVNVEGEARPLTIELAGARAVARHASVETLSGAPSDVNSIAAPEKVVPVRSEIGDAATTFAHTFPAYSVTVILLTAR